MEVLCCKKNEKTIFLVNHSTCLTDDITNYQIMKKCNKQESFPLLKFKAGNWFRQPN